MSADAAGAYPGADAYPKHLAVDFRQLKVRGPPVRVSRGASRAAALRGGGHRPRGPQLSTLKRYVRKFDIPIRPDATSAEYSVAVARCAAAALATRGSRARAGPRSRRRRGPR